jgi:hypothetical protein
MIDRDKLNMAPATAVGNVSMAVIDAVQGYPAEQRALGVAHAFLALCERFDLRPNDTFLTVQNILNDVQGPRPEFRAVKSYLREEMH